MHRFSVLLLCALCLIENPSLQASLIISEIMYKPSGANNTTPSDEWFELFNSGPTTVDLTTIKFAHSTNGSTGTLLNNGVQITGQSPSLTTTTGTGLAAGAYAVVGSKSLAAWQTVFGNLPVSTTYVQLSTWTNFPDGGTDLSLYSTTTGTTFFTINYSHPQRNGVSVYFSGTNAASAAPFSFSAGNWIDAPISGGGTSGDKHTAGTGSLLFTTPSTAPEPASLSLMGLAGAGLAFMARRRKAAQAIQSAESVLFR